MTPPVAAPRERLSVSQAATAVGKSRRTIYNWMAAGKVEFVRDAAGNPHVYADTLWRAGTVERPVDTTLPSRAAGEEELIK